LPLVVGEDDVTLAETVGEPVGSNPISVDGDDVTLAAYAVEGTVGCVDKVTDRGSSPNICTAPDADDDIPVPIHVDAPTTSDDPSLDRDTDEPKLAPSTDENLSPLGNTSLS